MIPARVAKNIKLIGNVNKKLSIWEKCTSFDTVEKNNAAFNVQGEEQANLAFYHYLFFTFFVLDEVPEKLQFLMKFKATSQLL